MVRAKWFQVLVVLVALTMFVLSAGAPRGYGGRQAPPQNPPAGIQP